MPHHSPISSAAHINPVDGITDTQEKHQAVQVASCLPAISCAFAMTEESNVVYAVEDNRTSDNLIDAASMYKHPHFHAR